MPASLPSPRRLGRYEILEELGRGGMGVVYKARDPELNRVVALKRLLPQPLTTPGVLSRFHMEAEAVAQLDHPNIVPLYEIGESGGMPFFSMKLAEGGNLASLLALERPPPAGPAGGSSAATKPTSSAKARFQTRLNRLLPLLIQVCRAVHHAHLRGILHRDIKPANILLNRQGDPLISDFGLAKSLDHDAGLTRTETVVGSPAYMAPEQAGGHAPVTTAADIYSLGVILYEILTGTVPFQGETPWDTVCRSLHEEPRAPKAFNLQVPRDLETVCLRCLEKDPARRYGSAQDLADDLDRWLSGKPIHARRVTWTERCLRSIRRNPGLTLTGCATLALLLGIGLIASFSALRIASADQLAESLLKAMQLEKAEFYFTQSQPNHALALLAHVLRKHPEDLGLICRLKSALSGRHFAWSAALPVHTQSRLVLRVIADSAPETLTVDEHGRVRRWNLESGAELELVFDFRKPTRAAHSTADGTWIALGFEDGHASLLNLATRAVISLPPQASSIRQVQLHPTGDRVLTVFGSTGYRLFAVPSGSPVSEVLWFPAHIREVGFSPDGERFLVTGETGDIHLMNSQTGRLEEILNNDGSPTYTAAFSPDARHLAAGALDGAIWIWDLAKGTCVQAEFRHRSMARKLVFQPAGSLLLSVGGEGEGRFHDVRTGAARGATMVHLDLIQHAEFNREGSLALTASHDNTVRVWRVPDGLPLVEPMSHLTGVELAVFSDDSRRVVSSCYDGTIWVWHLTAPFNGPVIHTRTAPVVAAEFNPTGDRVLSATRDGMVDLLNAATGELLLALPHDEPVTAARFDPHGKWIITGEANGRITIRDAFSGAPLHQWPPTESPVVHLDTGAFPGRLLALHGDFLVRVLSGDDFSAPPVEVEFTHSLVEAKLIGDASAFLTAQGNNRLALHSAETGQTLWETPRLGGSIASVTYIPETAELLYASGYSGRLSPLDNLSDFREFRHEMHVASIARSGDGKWVATASTDRTVGLWHLPTRDPVPQQLTHPAPVFQVEFSHDSRFLLTAADDHRVRIWDVTSGQLVAEPIPHTDRITSAKFSPDGSRILTAAVDGTTQLWALPQADLDDADWLVEIGEALARRIVSPDGRKTALSPLEYQQKLQELRRRHANTEFVARFFRP